MRQDLGPLFGVSDAAEQKLHCLYHAFTFTYLCIVERANPVAISRYTRKLGSPFLTARLLNHSSTIRSGIRTMASVNWRGELPKSLNELLLY